MSAAKSLWQVSMLDPMARRGPDGALRKLDTLVWAVSAVAAVAQAKRAMPPWLLIVEAFTVPELFDRVEFER